jgi:hypothetical protein
LIGHSLPSLLVINALPVAQPREPVPKGPYVVNS